MPPVRPPQLELIETDPETDMEDVPGVVSPKDLSRSHLRVPIDDDLGDDDMGGDDLGGDDLGNDDRVPIDEELTHDDLVSFLTKISIFEDKSSIPQ